MVTASSSPVALELENGTRLQRAGDLSGAVASFKLALTLDPRSGAAYNNLGNIFATLADYGTALTFYHASLVLEPDTAALHNNVANVFFQQGRFESAIASYRRAIGLSPEVAAYHNNLGNALLASDRIPEATAELKAAIRLKPDYADAHVNIALVFLEQDLLDQAEACYRTAIEIDPSHALAHHHLGHLLLRRGDLAAGFTEYEWRWRCSNFSSPSRSFQVPQWRGQPIAGQRLFVHAEQGFGDAIQCIRYIPLLAKRSIRVTLEIHPELLQLARTLEGVETLLARGDPPPAADWHCPLMSLPLAFDTRLDTIPANIPYLKAPSPRSFPDHPRPGKPFRVGLVWRTNPKTPFARRRSIPLDALRPLAALQALTFYCLQFRPTIEELQSSPLDFQGAAQDDGDVHVVPDIIAALDLVITVDTYTAHIAGALGTPTFILLPHRADWRWLLHREDSPWYPSATLYRQKTLDDWSDVISAVAADLAQLSSSQKSKDHV